MAFDDDDLRRAAAYILNMPRFGYGDSIEAIVSILKRELPCLSSSSDETAQQRLDRTGYCQIDPVTLKPKG